jgi:hypothetical protein
MPTEVAEQIQTQTKAYAKEVEKKLKAINDDFGPKYWEMAELIAEVHEKNLWQILGYENVKAYVETLSIAKSGWYAKRRHWQEFAKIALDKDVITRARLKRMPAQNVNHLLRLDERRRFDQRWIEKALTMKESEFEEQVDHVLENQTEPEEGLGKSESRATLKIDCSVGQKTFILESFMEFAKKNEIATDDYAKILEDLCAEWRSGN